LMDLQNELQDIADGFETRLTLIARRGYQTLSGETETQPKPEVSVFPIQPQEHQAGDGDLSDALLSRSAEEVIDALARADQLDDSYSASLAGPNAISHSTSSAEASQTASDTSTNADPEFSILPITPVEVKPIDHTTIANSDKTEHSEHALASQPIADESHASTPLSDSEPAFSILPVQGDAQTPMGTFSLPEQGTEGAEETSPSSAAKEPLLKTHE
jgi:hypothetical protein